MFKAQKKYNFSEKLKKIVLKAINLLYALAYGHLIYCTFFLYFYDFIEAILIFFLRTFSRM